MTDAARLWWLNAHWEKVGQSVSVEGFIYWSDREKRWKSAVDIFSAIDGAIAETVTPGVPRVGRHE